MVSTRSQSQNTPEPTTSPSKAAVARGSGGQASTAQPWAHRPSNLTIVWLAITVPLVLWDTGYILLRPYSMPGGSLHSPIWTPYALYGAVDYMYGWPAYNSRDGFPSGQGMMNLIECTMYTWYLWLVYSHGQPSAEKGRGAPKPSTAGWLGEAKVLSGPMAAEATLWLFSAGVMTLSKTILYWLCQYYSGFQHIGHNDWVTLILVWIIPNVPWLIVPAYMVYVSGVEIFDGLVMASGGSGTRAGSTTKDD